MKKLFALMLTFSLLLSLSACGGGEKQIVYTAPGELVRADFVPDYPFETAVLADTDTLHMAVKSSEQSADDAELVQLVNKDITAAAKATGCGATQKVFLCILDSVSIDYQQQDSSVLLCTKKQIRNGEYRECLMEELYGCHNTGVLYGLKEYIFGEREKDVDLKSYYDEPEHLGTLSLLAPYFAEGFADEATLAAAQETARQFVRYTIKRSGFETLLRGAFSEEIRTDWLKSIGNSSTYEACYDTAFFEDASVRTSKNFDLVLVKGNHQFNLAPLRYFETPLEVWKTLSQYENGVQNMLVYVKEHAPDAYKTVLGNWEKELTVSIRENAALSSAGGRAMTIQNTISLFHETAHILLGRVHEKDGAWTQEGMAEFLSCFSGEVLDSNFYARQVDMDFSVLDDGAEKDIWFWLLDYYHTHWQGEGFNQLVYYRAWGEFINRAGLPVPPEFKNIALSIAENNGLKMEPGNELTYRQSMLIWDYLSENKGFDQVMDYFFNDVAFTEAFGMDYLEALHAAEEYYI